MKRLFQIAFVAALALGAAATAFAASLDEAKAAGYVGERPDGLLGIVRPSPAAVAGLVDDINRRRLDSYQEIARRTGTSLPAVQAIAGEKAVTQSLPGTWVMDATGRWYQK